MDDKWAGFLITREAIRGHAWAPIAFAAATIILMMVMRVCPATAAPSEVVDLNIVAHQDDDLLFMQPDILNRYRQQGIGQVTVFVTAGNLRTDDTVYMRERELGALDALGQMGLMARDRRGVNAGSAHWTIHQVSYGEALVTQADGVEFPDLHAIFLRVPASKSEDGERIDRDLQDRAAPKVPNLGTFWNDSRESVAAVDFSVRYDRQRLIDLLGTILDTWKPRHVRTQDSDNPFPEHPNREYYDHVDHFYSALFAKAALGLHIGHGHKPSEYWIYQGYVIAGWEDNLSPEEALSKARLFYAYSVADRQIGPFDVTKSDAPEIWSNWGGRESGYSKYLQRQYRTQKPLPALSR
jgi:hypothetical protein